MAGVRSALDLVTRKVNCCWSPVGPAGAGAGAGSAISIAAAGISMEITGTGGGGAGMSIRIPCDASTASSVSDGEPVSAMILAWDNHDNTRLHRSRKTEVTD